MKARIPAVLAIAVLLLPLVARAFSVQTAYMDDSHKNMSRWAMWDLTYYVDSRGVTGVSATASQNAMTSSFQDWEDIDCSALTFQMLGNSSSQDILPITGTVNGKNELVWVTGSTECRKWNFGSSTLGVTLPMQDYFTGEIYESDIAFNNCDYNGKWAVNKNDLGWGEVSFKSVAIHEIGHFFGVQHSCLDWSEYNENDPATMAPYVDYYGLGDTLNADDELAACFLYPDQSYYAGNKGLYKCASVSDCPRIVTHNSKGEEVYDYENFNNGRLSCAGGYCIGLYGSQPGTTLQGVICQNDVACKGGICTDIGDGKPRCTEECSLANDLCPSGYHCETMGGQDICVTGSKAGGIGSRCSNSDDCVEGKCDTWPDGVRSCRIMCRSDKECPDGEYCWFKGSYGGCFPEVEVVLMGTGEYCTAGDQCESGKCVFGDDGMRCRVVCTDSDKCGEGFVCDEQSSTCLPGQEPVEPTLEVGDECSLPSLCRTGLCLQGSDGKRCREACGTSANCADGWYCETELSAGACLPGEPPVDLLEEGDVCSSDDECRSGLCFQPTAADTKRCRVECDLADWFCPTPGTACVGFDAVDSGVCMPVDDRGEVGDSCQVGSECVSGLCLGPKDDLYCSQQCVDDWCPEGFECTQVRDAGKFCIRTAAEVPDGGCSAGSGGGRDPAPLVAVFILVGLALAGRRFRKSIIDRN